MGMEKNKLRKRPIAQSDLQDLAAEGQYSLMKLYEDAFKRYGLGVWQILLTHHNFQTQAEIRNVIERIGNAFRKNKIPILNTNDPVTKEELIPSGSHAFSDNDPLAALVAKHTHSDALIIFSDSGNLGTGGGDSKESAIKKAEEAGVIVLVKSIGDMRSIFREILKSRQLSC
jgi:glutamate 5-kinase